MAKKVRVIIGPNGSGKTTFYHVLKNEYKMNMGYFINADEIQNKLLHNQFQFPKELLNDKLAERLNTFLTKSSINKKCNLLPVVDTMEWKKETLYIKKEYCNAYVAAAIAEFIRNEFVKNEWSFSFESVFSDNRKIKFMELLKKESYEIYLYVIATINPAINIKRVEFRVKEHGHSVSEEKIKSRYVKSLKNIKTAIPLAKRVFIVDNSQEKNTELIAEIEKSKTVYLHKTYQPKWVLSMLPKN